MQFAFVRSGLTVRAEDGRAALVDGLLVPDVPTVRIDGDFTSQLLLVTGRLDPGTAQADGRISGSGDLELLLRWKSFFSSL